MAVCGAVGHGEDAAGGGSTEGRLARVHEGDVPQVQPRGAGGGETGNFAVVVLRLGKAERSRRPVEGHILAEPLLERQGAAFHHRLARAAHRPGDGQAAARRLQDPVVNNVGRQRDGAATGPGDRAAGLVDEARPANRLQGVGLDREVATVADGSLQGHRGAIDDYLGGGKDRRMEDNRAGFEINRPGPCDRAGQDVARPAESNLAAGP